MKFKNYEHLKTEMERLRNQEKYQEIIRLLDEASEQLPSHELQEHTFDIFFGKAYYYTFNQQYQEVFDNMVELVEKGYPCPLFWERFNPLKQIPGYAELEEKNNILIAKEQELAEFDYHVHLPEGYSEEKKYPLFFALHGDAGNIKEMSEYWKPEPFLKNDFIFVYLQSSQVFFHDYFGWLKDIHISRTDIRACYDKIVDQYSIDQYQVLIGGYSGGAIASIDITIANILPVKGFIALCPSIKPEPFTRENVAAAVERGVRGVFLEGEKEIPMPDEEEMIQIFKEVGLPYQYYINQGIGHDVPADLSEKLEQAIEFIFRLDKIC